MNYIRKAYFARISRGSKVFLDLSIEGKVEGRLVIEVIRKFRVNIELFDDIVPKTSENFRRLCLGQDVSKKTGSILSYKGTKFFKINPGFISQSGDVTNNDGTGGESIYGPSFPDENYKISLSKPGILGMINKGKNANSSLFFITHIDCSFLDGKYVGFGEVVEGHNVLNQVEYCGDSKTGKPRKEVLIINCGELQTINNMSNNSKNMQKFQEFLFFLSKICKYMPNNSLTIVQNTYLMFKFSSLKKLFSSIKRPRVFMDISIDNAKSGRLTFELYSDITPKTAENFRRLCIGDAGMAKSAQVPLHYKGSTFHRIIPDFMAQGGDFTAHNGTGGESIYGATFSDENFKGRHNKPGILSMANRGKNTNSSQFFITFKDCSPLDGGYVVFGELVDGFPLLKKMELCGTRSERGIPTKKIVITDCGEIKDEVKAERKNEPKCEKS